MVCSRLDTIRAPSSRDSRVLFARRCAVQGLSTCSIWEKRVAGPEPGAAAGEGACRCAGAVSLEKFLVSSSASNEFWSGMTTPRHFWAQSGAQRLILVAYGFLEY